MRQFVIAPRGGIAALLWQCVPLSPHQELHVSPDLSLTIQECAGQRLILLGDMLDPRRSTAANADVLDSLLARTESLTDLIEGLRPIAGRWVLIWSTAEQLVLFPDACGTRSVLYFQRHGKAFCASQPNLFEHFDSLKPDPAAEQYGNTSRFAKNQEWWPGDSSPYDGMRRLLPNHYLDLRNAQTARYWPSKPREEIPYAEALARCVSYLEGIWASAVARYGKVALPVTGGLDSRILLAGSRKFSEHIYHFLSLHGGLNEHSADAAIATELCCRLDLRFDKHVFDRPVVGQHLADFLGTNALARESNLFILFTKYPHWSPEYVTITSGNINEVARCYYYGRLFETAPAGLSVVSGMGAHAFADEKNGEWLSSAREACRTCGYNPLDLYYWESRMGSWAATAFLEADFDHETFLPFNSRMYLETALAVDERARDKRHGNRFFIDMIAAMWPEVLEVPIDNGAPKGLGAGARHKLGQIQLLVRLRNQLRIWRLLAQ